MTSRVQLKICCIASLAEAELAITEGANAIGLVGNMPSGPGIISDDVAREIAAAVPGCIATFLLTSETTAQAIADHVISVGANTVQVVNHIDPAESRKLADLLPTTRRVQVIHVEGPDALDHIDQYQAYYDAFLLDSGRLSLPVPELGGTGRTHDWSVSQSFVEKSRIPVFLAGGLHPDNLAEAIRVVKPYGIDVCSGLRSQDQLDQQKVQQFVSVIRNASE